MLLGNYPGIMNLYLKIIEINYIQFVLQLIQIVLDPFPKYVLQWSVPHCDFGVLIKIIWVLFALNCVAFTPFYRDTENRNGSSDFTSHILVGQNEL